MAAPRRACWARRLAANLDPVLRRLLFAAVLAAAAGCATYQNDLNRGQRLYDESEYERALAIWRYLEHDLDSLSFADQARYAYLRGMTDYRLGGGKGGKDVEFRAHARHWLAIAKAVEQEHPGALTEQWKQLLEEALADLNAEIYGIEAAAAAPEPASQPAAAGSDAAPAAPATRDAGAGGAAPEAASTCAADKDCTGGQVCRAQQCVAP